MKKSTIKSLLLAVIVVCLTVATTMFTGAWFTDTKSAGSATITVGNAVTISVTGTLTGGSIMPGGELEFSKVTVKPDSGSSNLYLRAKVDKGASIGEALEFTEPTGWVKVGDYYYYAASAVTASSKMSALTELTAASAAVAYNLTASVDEDVTAGTTASATVLVPGSKITVTVTFQAIQSENIGDKTINDVVDAWGSLS